MDLSQIDMLGKGELVRAVSMDAVNSDASGAGWRKAGALGLAIAIIGLPINNIYGYTLLAVLAVIIFCGDVRAAAAAWIASALIVIVAALGQAFLAPSPIEEGHNIFLPSSALEQSLPSEVYGRM